MPPEAETALASALETNKLDIDVYKHLTTLSTGSIVLTASFLDRVKPNSSLKLAIPIAVVFLLFCTMYCVKSILLVRAASAAITRIRSVEVIAPENQAKEFEAMFVILKKAARGTEINFYFIQYSFMFGLTALVVFVVANIR
jgi:NADH:ubiquinone oxidoreductase subunit 3 (subunit A)